VTLALRADLQLPLTDQILGELKSGTRTVARIGLNRRLYTDAAVAVSPFRNVPVSVLDPASDMGRYTFVLSASLAAEQGNYPKGSGWATAQVRPTGAVSIVG